jgi:Putative adhesin
VEHDASAPVIRQQDFECAGPIDVFVELDSGRLDIQLEEDSSGSGRPGVAVQIRADPAGRPPWSAGIAGLLTWLGEQAGAAPPGELAAEAVRRTTIDFTGRRLAVHSPREFPLRTVPLMIQVKAPSGSSITARSGSADITVDGVAHRLDASTGAGQVHAQRCTGAAEVRTGSGDVRLGSVLGTLRVRTGSGEVDVSSIEDTADAAGAAGGGTVQTGSGDVRLGAVRHDVSARTGSGDLTVADASAGGLELTTGSGQLRVGIHPGVRAELDVSSGSGQARSDLPVGGPPPDGNVTLRVRARTGSGDALVTTAPS